VTQAFAIPEGFNWKRPDYEPVFAERAARLQAIRGGEIDLAALKAFYADDHPGEFIHDWGMTFDPRMRELGLSSSMPFLLFPRQQDFMRWLLQRWRGRDDGLAEKSRDMGVSYLCIGFAVWMLLFQPGTVVGFGSRKEEYVDDLNDPKALFWKARNLIELLPAEFKPKGWSMAKHAPFMAISNPENGSFIVGEAGDNIGRGNRASIYFKDESAFYVHPDVIDAALSQTANCKIDVSTPNGEGNNFARKRRSGRIPVFTFNWRDDPRKDQAWYDEQVRKIDDPVKIAQEIDISYAASTAKAYVPALSVIEAMTRGPAGIPPTGPWRLGVDVARFGDDKTAIILRGHRLAPRIATWGQLRTTEVTSIVVEFCRACARAGIRI
jgi:phage terminase large subunit